MFRAALLVAVIGLLAFALTTPGESSSSDESDSAPGLIAQLTGRGQDSSDAPRPKRQGPKQVYWQYVENGRVKFALNRDDVPEQWRARAGKVELDGPPPGSPAAARRAREARTAHVKLPSRRATSAAGDEAGQDYPEVVIYTTQSCPHCRKALAHLDRLGVPYTNKDVENDSRAEKEYLRKGKGRRGVPLIDVGGEILRGYSPKSLDAALERNS